MLHPQFVSVQSSSKVSNFSSNFFKFKVIFGLTFKYLVWFSILRFFDLQAFRHLVGSCTFSNPDFFSTISTVRKFKISPAIFSNFWFGIWAFGSIFKFRFCVSLIWHLDIWSILVHSQILNFSPRPVQLKGFKFQISPAIIFFNFLVRVFLIGYWIVFEKIV